MTASPQRLVIADPYPETIGLADLTIFVPEDFRGDAEIVWCLRDHPKEKRWIKCSATPLLQGLFRNVFGSCGANYERPGAPFDARVVALMVHAFYRARIEAVARLEAAYAWQSYPSPCPY